VIVQPRDAAYTIFAQSMDRSGFARGTLAPRMGMTAEVPALDARPLLSMADMGHGAKGHGEVDHSKMDHAAMGHAMPAAASPSAISHGADAHGPLADMVADSPSSALDDPGVGLRDNGRRVLTYADLRTLGGPIDARDASREIELHLTGHMERYVWSFDGRKFSDATPLRFAHGERLRMVLVNDTMMTHPIHLHGMWSELVDEKGAFLARKHTVAVRPGQRLAYLVTADALGHWAYHCHLLYHMEAGMFREVVVA
jgi:CopA family copper-resistance protein